ncbi:MAG: gluconate:H+ symporter [Bacteroidota bacterium]|nr:gluconate:H+ symporter [Bacteroidota bacterium]
MDYQIISAVIAGIALLLFLILRLKIQAFLSLLVVCIVVGLLSGMPINLILETMKEGMGSTLGFVATVVGLGALFGGILEQSGGAKRLADYLLKKTGQENASWAMVFTGFLVAIPVFFDVAFIILVPITYALSRTTKKSLLLYALPLLAGLAITHAFIPPTPGPIAVAEILGADLGWVIIFGILAGVPTAILGGPVFARFIASKITSEPIHFSESESPLEDAPSPALILTIIAVPIFLIVLNTLLTSGLIFDLPEESGLSEVIVLLGHPFTALIVANLLAWYFIGVKRGMSKEFLQKIGTKSFEAAGVIILLTGAGGAFKQVLIETGAGDMMASALENSLLNPLFFGFVIAALVRILQGSATVAMITSAGITAPVLASANFSSPEIALIVIAIASGATGFSHVNDSGFWLVGKYLGLSEKQTFRSWTLMTTIIAFAGLGASWIIWILI